MRLSSTQHLNPLLYPTGSDLKPAPAFRSDCFYKERVMLHTKVRLDYSQVYT